MPPMERIRHTRYHQTIYSKNMSNEKTDTVGGVKS